MSASEDDEIITRLVRTATFLLMAELLTGGIIVGFVLGWVVFR